MLHNTNSSLWGLYKDKVLPLRTWHCVIRFLSCSAICHLCYLFLFFAHPLSWPFTPLPPPQGVWLRRQEAGQLSRECLSPVCRVGPRTTGVCHRQLYQQGHVVAAPVEGKLREETKLRADRQWRAAWAVLLLLCSNGLMPVACVFWVLGRDTKAIFVHQLRWQRVLVVGKWKSTDGFSFVQFLLYTVLLLKHWSTILNYIPVI